MNKKWAKFLALPLAATMLITGCSNSNNGGSNASSSPSGDASVAPADKPATWIADRKIKGLVFMGTDDYTEDMNPEIKAEIKKRTGIDFEIEIMKASKSIDGLIAGIAANDLPDFIAFYLNNSGRPEMSVVLKAAREGVFTDLTPLMKDTKVYSKYLQEDFLPNDTKYGVMFRPEFNGSTYFIHMNVNREGGYDSRKYAGGPYIRKDIADALGVDPRTIKTTDQLYELAKKIKQGGFKDSNGKDVVPIGPNYWGGQEIGKLFGDLEWGEENQWIRPDESGKMQHEAQNPLVMKKVEYVQKLLSEKLIHPEFFTLDESQSTEGALNGTWGIIANMHNYQDFNQDMHYLPLGPLNGIDGEYQMQVAFKSGYSAWAIPSTTKNPEDIMKFADYLATREGKLLWKYGLEGRDYTLGADGNPLVKQEVMDLRTNDSNAAKALGFGGVKNYWGELLGSTDIDWMADFGEMEYGDKLQDSTSQGALEIAKYWDWDAKRANANVFDAYSPNAFLGEFARGNELKAAFDNYKDSLVKAYYSQTPEAGKAVIDSALKQMQAAGLDDYLKLLDQKHADPHTKISYRAF